MFFSRVWFLKIYIEMRNEPPTSTKMFSSVKMLWRYIELKNGLFGSSLIGMPRFQSIVTSSVTRDSSHKARSNSAPTWYSTLTDSIILSLWGVARNPMVSNRRDIEWWLPFDFKIMVLDPVWWVRDVAKSLHRLFQLPNDKEANISAYFHTIAIRATISLH